MVSEYVEKSVRAYRRADRRRLLYALLMILTIFAVCVYSLSISRVDISFVQAMEVIWNNITGDLPSRTEDYLSW